jgi:mRNA-degrading endonuclease toxin of MazEF toxin-antitoxin module
MLPWPQANPLPGHATGPDRVPGARGSEEQVALGDPVCGLPKPSVANVTRLVTLDRVELIERTGRLSTSTLALVLAGIETLLGRP